MAASAALVPRLEDRTLSIEGAPVGVTTFPGGLVDENRVVVCVPGMGALGSSFAPSLRHIQDRHQFLMVTPALETPAGVSPIAHTARVLASDALPTPKTRPFDVLASSYGTLPAIAFALQHPGRVRSLVLITPVASRSLAGASALLGAFMRVPLPLIAPFSWFGGKIFGGIDLEGERLDFIRNQMETMSEPEMARRLQDLSRSTLEDHLGALKPRVTILHGRRDLLPLAISRGVAARIPHAELRVVEGGHMPYLSDPEGFALEADAALRPRRP